MREWPSLQGNSVAGAVVLHRQPVTLDQLLGPGLTLFALLLRVVQAGQQQ